MTWLESVEKKTRSRMCKPHEAHTQIVDIPETSARPLQKNYKLFNVNEDSQMAMKKHIAAFVSTRGERKAIRRNMMGIPISKRL
jgi:hypothetical protein